MRKYKIIGLTGPTGSGKSIIGEFLKENEVVKIIDTDEIAREATKNKSACAVSLNAVFGGDLLDENGDIIRMKLASRAFSTKEDTKLLNDIVHPWVFLKVFEKINEYKEQNVKYIFIDAPVLIESNGNAMCDIVVSVLADEETRINRVIKRDNITLSQAKLRINAQNNDEFYVRNSDYVIYNDKDLESIKNKSLELINFLNEV